MTMATSDITRGETTCFQSQPQQVILFGKKLLGLFVINILKYMLLEDFDNISLYFLGSWCSFAAWLTVFILMITLRQHLKAHLTDESMWGSQYGGNKSRRSGSRMSERSFDA